MNKSSKIIITVFSWLAVFATMAVIARFSLQNSSDSSSTSEALLKLIPFYDRLSPEALDVIHLIIRKMAHFTIYALLGFTSYNAFNVSIKLKCGFVYLISVGFASTYAIIDEFVFQALSPGRAPMLLDVVIDTLGAPLGALLMFLIILIIKLIKNKETSL
ncbi:MAG: VanZ family protein [Clostridia bacterium]|nr:VanZ family protein [Clostridia bacterium]